MKVTSVQSIKEIPVRKSDVVLRMDSIRASIRKYGMAVIDLDKETDLEAVKRLKKIHGAENVMIEQSSSAKLIIQNFKGVENEE